MDFCKDVRDKGRAEATVVAVIIRTDSLSTQQRERKRKGGGSSSSIRAISFHPCTEEDSATNGLGKNILQN